MTMFQNLPVNDAAMRKITAQCSHTCAETGAKINPGMVVYYEDATRNYYSLNSQAVKNFLLSGDGSLTAEEDISE
jgi:hypothetical protein